LQDAEKAGLFSECLYAVLVARKSLGSDHEMAHEPIADRCGHLVKVFLPSELVIGVR
jgi:hypothetical protein